MFFKKNKPRIIISNEKFGIIKDHLNLTHIPKEGELIFFDSETEYWVVLKVVYNISDKNSIWIIVIPQENIQKS